MKADAATERDVIAVMNRMADAYRARDIAGVMACFVPDADVVMYGTGADEKRVGLEQIRFQAERDWAQSDEVSLKLDWVSVSAAGNVAWVAADTTLAVRVGDEALSFPARTTAVLEKRDGAWLLAQAHFSFPAAGQEEGESF